MAEQVIVCMRSLPQGTAREVSALGHRLAWRALGLLLDRAEQQLFEQVIKFSIRNGDIYTVYNPCQILVLLLQADPASGREVAGRICRTWENVKGDIRTRMEITWENAGNPAQRRRKDEEECHVPGADFQSAKCHVAGICDLDGKE